MKQKQDHIEEYAYKLLKRKNYFIRDLYHKLKDKYDVSEVNRVIKNFICMELLNDRYLTEMKVCYFIHIKMYGINYIHKYFKEHNISLNLVKFVLSKYDEKVYEKNINEIKIILKNKGKSEDYINNYLLRKGYLEEQIKNM